MYKYMYMPVCFAKYCIKELNAVTKALLVTSVKVDASQEYR